VRTNHLIEPIQCILETANAPLSEYALIGQLQAQGWLEPIDSSNTLSLYSAHFLVYNALFHLHLYYLEHNQFLTISALQIYLTNGDDPTESSSTDLKQADETNQADMVSLRDYYLDWSHLDGATKESVSQLLNSFWEHFVNHDEYVEALTVLMLPSEKPVDYQQVKVAYQKLAMQHHPDRGGDVEQFQRINWAFGVLRRAL
jgi:hypothetical protein